ncbi:RNA-binding protein, CCR4-NOT complex subunit Rcd1 [Cytospora paraplurivora]|uniref:RNA-binding protein, CCR4-NOT complex subunit Rcd1 n=1 Tax=Cytospora paraplurivora TaxID=2898453 RepID=A0AAN9UGV3_9PEZI
MMPNHPMYGQHHYPQDASAWMHPQSHHQHAQQAAAAAAASAAQQAHFNRIATTANHASALNAVHQDGGSENPNMSEDNRRTMQYIADLLNENTREQALLELSKKREQVPELALILWHSFGVMTSLVQEIISVYTLLNPSQLTAAASNRVCNALALLQCVASHNETRTLFLNAHIPLYLYPFLNTTSKSRPFEYLRLTSLGVIGALVKNDSTEVINFLLTTEIIPLCLRIMETGSELSKTVAIFIVQKILLDDNGLNYICATYERFYAVGTVLSNMVGQLVEQQTARLLKHVVRCFLRLSDNARAREALRQCLPEPLRDATFSSVLRDDAATKRCLTQLLKEDARKEESGTKTEGKPPFHSIAPADDAASTDSVTPVTTQKHEGSSRGRKSTLPTANPKTSATARQTRIILPAIPTMDPRFLIWMDVPPSQTQGTCSTELVEEAPVNSLINDLPAGGVGEHRLEGQDNSCPLVPVKPVASSTPCKTSSVSSPEIADEEPLSRTDTENLTDRKDERLRNEANEEPVDSADEDPINPQGEEPASPVPLPGAKARGKKRFKTIPELSSSSNRPTL